MSPAPLAIYLVPASLTRHELYSEVSAAAAPAPDERPASLWGRLTETFRRALAEGEAEQRRDERGDAPQRGRVRRFVTRRLAEAVAEQRLLWQLRHQTQARLVLPDDLAAPDALAICLRLIATDRDKHRRWCAIDALLTLASGLVAVIPGPNLLAYYFIFRTVGHYLSMKGAQQALTRVTWTTEPSPELTALRAALVAGGDERRRRVEATAGALGLDRLARFVDRVADRSR